jgi:hypothetical protein
MTELALELRVRIASLPTPTPLYEIAADAHLHPGRLGQMLRGTVPLTEDVARRVREAIERRVNAAGNVPVG